MSRRAPASSTLRRIAPAMLAVLGLIAAGHALPGCAPGADRDPRRREPALLIDGAALTRLLTRTQSLVGTPAGHLSAQLLERLQGCHQVAGHFAPTEETDAPVADGARVHDQLVCREDAKLDPALASLLERERGEHAGILQWPVGGTGRAVVWLDVDPAGGLEIGGALEPSDSADGGEDAGLASLLIPAATAPGESVIDTAESLLHLQLRPAAGLRLAEMIPSGSQGDRLFALKGRLLEGALLEGTLELAFVPPAPGGSVPLAILALHHRGPGPVEAALAEALDRLEQTWAIARTPHRFATADGERLGGCYADLPILPELAPCWLVTERALLIGYRAEALEGVLAADLEAPGAASDRGSHLVVDFERVRALDERLADAPGTGVAQLYSRLELQGRADAEGRVALEGQLRARP